MDYIKLAQRTISMLSSMIESGECHTTRTREMVNNAQNGLEQLRQYNVVRQSEQLNCEHEWKVEGFDCYGFPISKYCEKCNAKEEI